MSLEVNTSAVTVCSKLFSRTGPRLIGKLEDGDASHLKYKKSLNDNMRMERVLCFLKFYYVSNFTDLESQPFCNENILNTSHFHLPSLLFLLFRCCYLSLAGSLCLGEMMLLIEGDILVALPGVWE